MSIISIFFLFHSYNSISIIFSINIYILNMVSIYPHIYLNCDVYFTFSSSNKCFYFVFFILKDDKKV